MEIDFDTWAIQGYNRGQKHFFPGHAGNERSGLLPFQKKCNFAPGPGQREGRFATSRYGLKEAES
jgi:hypothetical protein